MLFIVLSTKHLYVKVANELNIRICEHVIHGVTKLFLRIIVHFHCGMNINFRILKFTVVQGNLKFSVKII